MSEALKGTPAEFTSTSGAPTVLKVKDSKGIEHELWVQVSVMQVLEMSERTPEGKPAFNIEAGLTIQVRAK